MKNMIRQIPIPLAGVILGITSLGNLIQEYSETLRLICGGIGALLAVFLLLKFIIHPRQIVEDYQSPIIASVSATIFMSVMQLSTYAYPYIGQLAYGLWLLAIISHLILMVWYAKKFLFRFRLEEIFPTVFITYVGIIVGSVTSATFGQQSLGHVLFWLGFSLYVIAFMMITYRYMKVEIPESARPLFCIYTAPMSLSLAGYLTVATDVSLPFIFVLEILAQLLYLVVLTRLPKLLKLSFYPSFAAFTFPFVITALALKKYIWHLESLQLHVPEFLKIILLVETCIAVVMVLYTLGHFINYLFQHLKTDMHSKTTVKYN